MTDQKLIDAIRSKQPAEMERAVTFLYRHKSYVTDFIKTDTRRKFLGIDQSFCDDLFQEVMLAFIENVWHGLFTLQDGVDIKTYLYKLSHRRYFRLRDSELRRMEREGNYLLLADDEAPDADQLLSKTEDNVIIDTVLKRMGQAAYDFIRMFHYEERSHREIGEILGISEAAAKQRYYRYRLQLAELLKSYELPG